MRRVRHQPRSGVLTRPRWPRPSTGLAGATPRDGALACLAAGGSVLLVAAVASLFHGAGAGPAETVPAIAASAILLFVLPGSPMSQPWPVLGGYALAAVIGLLVGREVGHGAGADGLAVAAAVAAMWLTGTLHPPAVGIALSGAIGGPFDDHDRWLFALTPVMLNVVTLLVLAWAFHRLSRRPYPHRAPPTALEPSARDRAELHALLRELHEVLDVSEDDLGLLLRALEERERERDVTRGPSGVTR